jgi:hypothetical protein
MKENLKAMLMYSKSPLVRKTTRREKIMFCTKLLFLPKTKRTDSEYLSHQDGLAQLGTKTLSLVIVFLSITLVIKKYIVKHMEEMINYGKKQK